jgi:hypothetical protein
MHLKRCGRGFEQHVTMLAVQVHTALTVDVQAVRPPVVLPLHLLIEGAVARAVGLVA